ncbi:MAG: hypothetical protein NC543_02565 [bacterium]|nr:hypothetical protein [bacterium]MCM1374245.1 hypothetical protein [Muribaculum sp.]
MRSGKRALVAVGACILALAGCGEAPAPEPISTTTIVLEADGSFIHYRVEDFDSEYYQLSELDGMIRQEVQDYVSKTAKESQPVAVEQVDTLEENRERVMVALRFADSEVYGDYIKEMDQQSSELFYGTVQEALARGYDLSGCLQDTRKGTAITAEQLEKNQQKMILIYEEAMQIRCPSKVLYVSGNVRLTDRGYVDAAGEGLKYVMIK